MYTVNAYKAQQYRPEASTLKKVMEPFMHLS